MDRRDTGAVQTVEPLLGTRAEVHVTATTASVATAAEHQIIAEVSRLEGLFTVFDETSAMNELRRTGSTTVAELIEVGELAAEWQERSGGVFDPRLQSLVELWDRAEVAGERPSDEELGVAVQVPDDASARFDNLNAIAKGWIAQAALGSIDFENTDVRSAWLSLGGDIAHRGSGSVVVGIEDPHRPFDNVAPLATLEIANEAVATSGGARRWWTIDDRRYSKVLDPRTGQPVDHIASATIVAPSAAVADVLATIATVTDIEHTLALVHHAGADCLLIHRDGSHTCSTERFVFG